MYSRLKAEAEINLPLQAARVTIRQIVTMHPYAGSQVQISCADSGQRVLLRYHEPRMTRNAGCRQLLEHILCTQQHVVKYGRYRERHVDHVV